MFVTEDVYKDRLSSVIAPPGTHVWLAVEVELQQPWYLIEVESRVDEPNGSTMRRTLLSCRLQDVIDASRQRGGSNASMKSVCLVSPRAMNKTQGWRMERLRAIWSATEPSSPDRHAQILEVDDGKMYVLSLLDTKLEDLVDRKRVALWA